MAHQREIIRKKAVALLLNQTAAGASVFANRVEPLMSRGWESELPAIVIYTLDETGEIFNSAPREYSRTVQLVVEIQAAASSSLDDVLDNIARQVELILLRDDTLDGTADDLRYVRTRMSLRDEAETLIGACLMQFDVDYLELHPNEQFNESLPDLNTVTTGYSLSNEQSDPADRAHTIIEGLNL